MELIPQISQQMMMSLLVIDLNLNLIMYMLINKVWSTSRKFKHHKRSFVRSSFKAENKRRFNQKIEETRE